MISTEEWPKENSVIHKVLTSTNVLQQTECMTSHQLKFPIRSIFVAVKSIQLLEHNHLLQSDIFVLAHESGEEMIYEPFLHRKYDG